MLDLTNTTAYEYTRTKAAETAKSHDHNMDHKYGAIKLTKAQNCDNVVVRERNWELSLERDSIHGPSDGQNLSNDLVIVRLFHSPCFAHLLCKLSRPGQGAKPSQAW